MKFGNLFAGSALIKRTLALCIALVLLGSLFVSAYAAELTEEIQPPEEEPAAAVLTYDTHFGKLRELSKGETVIFTDMEGIVSIYCVEKLETLSPDAVDTVLNSGYDLVLYTCTKGGGTRVIVFCDRAAETASSSAPRQTEK